MTGTSWSFDSSPSHAAAAILGSDSNERATSRFVFAVRAETDGSGMASSAWRSSSTRVAASSSRYQRCCSRRASVTIARSDFVEWQRSVSTRALNSYSASSTAAGSSLVAGVLLMSPSNQGGVTSLRPESGGSSEEI